MENRKWMEDEIKIFDCYLWCHKHRCSCLAHGGSLLQRIFRCSKIGEFRSCHISLRIKRNEEQVIWLQITVDDAFGMKELKSALSLI